MEIDETRLTWMLREVLAEFRQASAKYKGFNSTHEGYAVLLEEVDELWQEVKHGVDPDKQTREAIQVAAMALRFLHDCCWWNEEV